MHAAGAGWRGVAAGGGSGGEHTCAIAGSLVECWGYNGAGELGNGTLTQSLLAGNVGLQGTVDLQTNSEISCAVTSGVLRCWGWNQFGQLGTGSTALAQVSVPTLVGEP